MGPYVHGVKVTLERAAIFDEIGCISGTKLGKISPEGYNCTALVEGWRLFVYPYA